MVPAEPQLPVRAAERTGKHQSFIKVVDLPASFKDRPSCDESPSYLLGWLAGYFAADGCVAKDGTVILNSARREDLEFVRLIASRVGLGTYGITEQRRAGFVGRERLELSTAFTSSTKICTEDFFLLSQHRLRFAGSQKAWTRRGWVVKSVEATDRVEEVFCAIVPEEHAFTLEDNILTGNCFGCQANGDAISFVREVEHLDFVDAVERLAPRAGITLRYDDKSVTKDKGRKARLNEAVAAAIDVLRTAAARVTRRRHRAQVPARSRLRRRRGAPVQARVVARRVGPRERAPAAAEVLAQRHRRRRSRVREQGEQAAGPVPRPPHVPDLRQQGRTGRLRRPRARRRRPEVQELARDARSTRRAGCCTGSTGRRPRSWRAARSSSARATPT